MKRLEAAEQGFSQANRYYLLMWVLVSVVFVTAFVEHRAYRKEWAATETTIQRYAEVGVRASEAMVALRSILYETPAFASEEASLRALRERYAGVRDRLLALRRLPMSADVTPEQRAAINDNLNRLIALIFFNDATVAASGLPHIAGMPALSLAEHDVGTLRTAGSVGQLRMEDAGRFIWLGSLDLARWDGEISRFAPPVSGADADSVAERLDRLASDERGAGARALAARLWVAWLRPDFAGQNPQERWQRQNLTLDEPQRILLAAYRQQAELTVRRTGETSKVTLPIFSLPVTLGDAIVVLPAGLLFCALAMLIYTRRGLRYAPDSPSKTEVVGSIPVYYAPYGASPRAMALTVCLAMLAAPLLVAAAIPLFLVVVPAGWGSWSLVYWGLLIATVILIGNVYLQSWRIIDLIDRDIAIKALPADKGSGKGTGENQGS